MIEHLHSGLGKIEIEDLWISHFLLLEHPQTPNGPEIVI
jgi:hypothetical protein